MGARTGPTVDKGPLGVSTEEAESSSTEYRQQTIVVESRRVIRKGNKTGGNGIITEREAKVLFKRSGLIQFILNLATKK